MLADDLASLEQRIWSPILHCLAPEISLEQSIGLCYFIVCVCVSVSCTAIQRWRFATADYTVLRYKNFQPSCEHLSIVLSSRLHEKANIFHVQCSPIHERVTVQLVLLMNWSKESQVNSLNQYNESYTEFLKKILLT